MPIEKQKNRITVKIFFDGDQDATDIFVSLIADLVSAEKEQDTVDYHERVIYNEGRTQSLNSSGVTEVRQ